MDRLAKGVVTSSTLSSAVVAMTGGVCGPSPSSSVTANCLDNFCLLTLVIGAVSVSMTTRGEGRVGRSLDDGTDKPKMQHIM